MLWTHFVTWAVTSLLVAHRWTLTLPLWRLISSAFERHLRIGLLAHISQGMWLLKIESNRGWTNPLRPPNFLKFHYLSLFLVFRCLLSLVINLNINYIFIFTWHLGGFCFQGVGVGSLIFFFWQVLNFIFLWLLWQLGKVLCFVHFIWET
jgi:hypothetical protein